ncbi:serine/threonine protein kinase [Pseudanabaena sp. PCC 6802]|uniref:serine/threonine protein kinase n=1 Tax=Pseudanabaena sp. PCC 6802 TaxID=118173 RepID=UPI0003450CB9|nr:serine/threonine protein kinase [Pseudanabaena sp. PCC 6802]
MAAKVLDGRYKLIKVLGVGGFGRTYVARDMRRPGSPICVVKQLKPASDDPTFIREARRLFNTEAETLEKLGKHDRIPQLLAYFEEENQFFLVQEFIEGKSLYEEMKPLKLEEAEPEDTPKGNASNANSSSTPQQERQLSEPEVLAMLQDTLHVLEFVHAEGVIHRDIKPENLIRRKSDGKLVLIDFGAVKALQEPGSKLETSTNGESRFTVTIGTPGYMPSEQCAGRPNFSSDIYAVGMLAIKALTGFSPTDLPTDPDTGELVWRDRTKVSNGLAMVLTRMVRYHYNQRYQSVKEVQQALSAFTITEEQKQKDKDAAGSSAMVKASATSQAGGMAAARTTKPQPRSNTSSGLLLGVLLLVVGVTAFTVPLLLRPQKSSITTTPAPTIGANTPNPQASPTPNPQATPNSQASPTASPGSTTQTPSFSQSLTLKVSEEKLEEGSLKADLIKSYTFDAKEGQELKTELTGEHITMSVVGPDKEYLATQTLSWSGKLRFNGTYQIQLKASKDNPESNYKLKVLLTEPDAPPTRTIEITPTASPTATPAPSPTSN